METKNIQANNSCDLTTEESIFKSKYHRKQPICDFSPCHTMYDLVRTMNADHLSEYYASYLGRNITFSQLLADADKLAMALYAEGVKKDQIIGVCLLTTPEVCPVLLSINKIGAVSYWMDASLKPTDFQQYIVKLGIETIIIYEPLAPIFLQFANGVGLKRIIVVPADPMLGLPPILDKIDSPLCVNFNTFIQNAHHISIPEVSYEKDRITVIVQSSGSTGKPKSIAHTDYNLNSAVLKMAYCDLPFYRQKRALVCAPPWVVYGLVNSIYSGLVLGLQTVFSTQPKEEMIYSHLGQFDFAYGVPVYLRYLYSKLVALRMTTDEISRSELARICQLLNKIDLFISGGDKIAEDELILWQIEFDKVIINGHGNNEVTGAVIVSPRFANRPGSIGIPMHGICAEVFDNETGEKLPAGQIGELCIHSDSLFKEYFNDAKTTHIIKQLHNGEAWVHTGDLAIIDKDGFVFLRGRTRRLIIDKLGYKISPENSENLIMGIEEVIESVVVGAEIHENDTVPIAFIEFSLTHKNDKELLHRIEKTCHDQLKEYECPKFFIEVPSIPHKANGGKRDVLALEHLAQDLILSGILQRGTFVN